MESFTYTYSPSVVASNIDKILKAADALQSGCFVFVRKYRSSNGEVANYWLNYGREYARIKEKFIGHLESILSKSEPFLLNVKYTTWVDEEGVEYPVKAKGRTEKQVDIDLTIDDPDVKQAIQELMRAYGVKRVHGLGGGTSRFKKQAKGIYVKNGSIHFRMSTLCMKKVVQPATITNYSIRKVAIKQTLKDKFLKLRAFKLSSMESMSLGGHHLVGISEGE